MIIVKASPGLKCPMELNPREYITDAVGREVPDTTYYRRLISDGSLQMVDSGSIQDEGGDQ